MGKLATGLMAGAALACAVIASAEEVVVASVGAHLITRRMLDDAVQSALNSTFYHRSVSAERRIALEREQLDALVKRELNALGASDRGLAPPDGDAEAMRKAIEQKMGRDAYKGALTSSGITRKQHAQALAKTLLAQRGFQRFVIDTVIVTDAEVRQAYDATPDRYRVPETARIEEILLKVPPDSPAERWAQRSQEARVLIERIHAGELFANVAAVASEDMYRVKGGDLGWVHRGRLLPELEAAAWSAPSGVVVGPVRSLEGLHVLRVVERRGPRQMAFAETAPYVRKALEAERRRIAEESWYRTLRERYPVTIFEAALR